MSISDMSILVTVFAFLGMMLSFWRFFVAVHLTKNPRWAFTYFLLSALLFCVTVWLFDFTERVFILSHAPIV